MIYYDIQQGSQEWKDLRSGKATASNFSDVLMDSTKAGYQNYKTRLILERILGKSLDDGYTNKAMQDGNEREPIARMKYEIASGNMVQEVSFVDNKFYKMVGCSPDGLIGDDGGIEIKCGIQKTHYDYLFLTEAPAIYKAQVQGNLMVTGRKWWEFVSFNPDFPEHLQLKIIRCFPDVEYIKKLEVALIAFNNDVEAGILKLKSLK